MVEQYFEFLKVHGIISNEHHQGHHKISTIVSLQIYHFLIVVYYGFA
jgi:hypothetical protein